MQYGFSARGLRLINFVLIAYLISLLASIGLVSALTKPAPLLSALMDTGVYVCDQSWTQPCSDSQLLSLRGRHHGQYGRLQSHRRHPSVLLRAQAQRVWQESGAVRHSFQLFFPRKLAPPAATDDPWHG
jgi:hypothetical protein